MAWVRAGQSQSLKFQMERVCVCVCGGASGLQSLPCSSYVDPWPQAVSEAAIMSVFLLAFPHPDLD